MVDRKGLKAINRNGLLIIFLVLGIMVFVFAAGVGISGIGTLANNGNYSGTITLNCSTNMNQSETGFSGYNVTFYYSIENATDYSVSNNLSGLLWNKTQSSNDTWITIDTITLLGGLVDSSNYTIFCYANNGTDQNTSQINITIDNHAPRVTNFVNTVDGGIYNGTLSLILNVSVNDSSWNGYAVDKMRGVGSVYFNITNSSGIQLKGNYTQAFNHTDSWLGSYYNATLNITNEWIDGVYTITVWANETVTDEAYFQENSNRSESISITIDNTVPSSVVLTRGTGSSISKNVITITAADAMAGINTCTISNTLSPRSTITGSGSSIQTLTQIGLNCGKSYSYIVTCRDFAGHATASTSTSFSTNTCAGGSIIGSSTTVSVVEKVNILNIVPETESILSNFDEDIGVKEMKLSVTEVANGVKVTVRKFDTKPAEITFSKTGNVHKYLQVETENLGTKLERAVLTIKVQKNWLSDNGIDKANMALFRFNEVAGNWDELPTVYSTEDNVYYYYDVELTSFSYFAIAEKVIEESGPGEGEEIEGNLLWLWIVIGIVVVAVIIGGGITVKKKKK
jgi:PGF-pre-PGF domain-containing protein